MFHSLPLIVLCCLATSVFASPLRRDTSGCDLSQVQLSLPSNQTQFAIPAGATLKFLAIGVGVQNYTCASGVFSSVGAVATLYDASCAASDSTVLDALPTALYTANAAGQPLEIAGATPFKLGDHFFIINPITGSGVSPEFDFTASQNDPNAFVVAKKAGDISAPTDSADNIDWLKLSNVQGSLATTVFRVQTKGGQPATSCTGTDSASIQYAAQYWFYE